MHIVSEVEGCLAPHHDVWDLLMASFPAGTVSGAPKIRAMQLIHALEPDARGPYSGVYGSVDLAGALNTAITIRTMVVQPNGSWRVSCEGSSWGWRRGRFPANGRIRRNPQQSPRDAHRLGLFKPGGIMTSPLLLKGFEVELFTGLPSGQNVGVASDVAAALDDFVTEPDCRNVEYITAPIADYHQLSEALLQPRRRLRTWLASRDLTLLPGSTLSLGDSSSFERSDPTNSISQTLLSRPMGRGLSPPAFTSISELLTPSGYLQQCGLCAVKPRFS